jgi:hypothetical protein
VFRKCLDVRVGGARHLLLLLGEVRHQHGYLRVHIVASFKSRMRPPGETEEKGTGAEADADPKHTDRPSLVPAL